MPLGRRRFVRKLSHLRGFMGALQERLKPLSLAIVRIAE